MTTKAERDARDARICQGFKAGRTIPQLAEEFGMSNSGIGHALTRAGLAAKDGGRAKATST